MKKIQLDLLAKVPLLQRESLAKQNAIDIIKNTYGNSASLPKVLSKALSKMLRKNRSVINILCAPSAYKNTKRLNAAKNLVLSTYVAALKESTESQKTSNTTSAKHKEHEKKSNEHYHQATDKKPKKPAKTIKNHNPSKAINIEVESIDDEDLYKIICGSSTESLKGILKSKAISLTPEQAFIINREVLARAEEKKGTIQTITREGKVRTNQSGFRTIGLSYYGECIVTGTSLQGVLDAAHIQPANGNNDSLDNCLILEANWHRLFDRGYWSINPSTNCVELSQTLKDQPNFSKYHGKVLKIRANKAYLSEHYQAFKSQP
ncbi:HNH endonuclease [Ferrimonas balearica]|uniref:HNH endonuclease n=1 Tax=Ferrimonas balearica TaxID=44012 RepID=UPI001C57A5C3|nr:HNH endonuclease [Ferrimonas balearica]MBW3141595.1 HNH endonuclease [Ferrimonas balearica]